MTTTDFTLPDSAPVSQRVVQAVATATETDPRELTPLFDAIDPESLNRLFESTNRGAERSVGAVTFDYAGCEVTVYADETVDVTVRDAPSTAQTGSLELE